MALRHKMSDQCAPDKTYCSLNSTRHWSARLPPSDSFIERVSVSGTISLVRACKYTRSPWNKIASISVCVQESTESDRLKSKAERDINAHCRPLECWLKASWPWWMLPRIEVIERDRKTRSKRAKRAAKLTWIDRKRFIFLVKHERRQNGAHMSFIDYKGKLTWIDRKRFIFLVKHEGRQNGVGFIDYKRTGKLGNWELLLLLIGCWLVFLRGLANSLYKPSIDRTKLLECFQENEGCVLVYRTEGVTIVLLSLRAFV